MCSETFWYRKRHLRCSRVDVPTSAFMLGGEEGFKNKNWACPVCFDDCARLVLIPTYSYSTGTVSSRQVHRRTAPGAFRLGLGGSDRWTSPYRCAIGHIKHANPTRITMHTANSRPLPAEQHTTQQYPTRRPCCAYTWRKTSATAACAAAFPHRPGVNGIHSFTMVSLDAGCSRSISHPEVLCSCRVSSRRSFFGLYRHTCRLQFFNGW